VLTAAHNVDVFHPSQADGIPAGSASIPGQQQQQEGLEVFIALGYLLGARSIRAACRKSHKSASVGV